MPCAVLLAPHNGRPKGKPEVCQGNCTAKRFRLVLPDPLRPGESHSTVEPPRSTSDELLRKWPCRCQWSRTYPMTIRSAFSGERSGPGKERDVAASGRGDSAKLREEKLEEIASRLEAAVEELTTGEDWIRAITFAARFRSRSFGNTLLICSQHVAAYVEGRVTAPYPTYVAGYKQWQQLGRSVKGQTGYKIYAPVKARLATATPADSTSWRRLARYERPRSDEIVRVRTVGMRPAYVWDVSQTTGPPLPERPAPELLAGQAPDGLWDGLVAKITAAGYTVTTAPDASTLHGANGVTDFVARTVQVRADMDPAARVKTLAHEHAHITLGHESRRAECLHRGIGEVEAESVAMMIAATYGMDTSNYTIPYVSTWAAAVDNTRPVDVVRATGERVRATALEILAGLPEPPIGDGRPPGLAELPEAEREVIGQRLGPVAASRAADRDRAGHRPVVEL